jgi:hypothetical protein
VVALGRLADRGSLSELRLLFEASELGTVREHALLAMLRIGDDTARAYVEARSMASTGSPILAALAGSPNSVTAAVRQLKCPTPTEEQVWAAGLLGDLRAVRPLVVLLGNEALGSVAAECLDLITGASLEEDAFIPEVLASEEMFEHELAAFRATGAQPNRGDGRQFGSNVRRPARDSVRWNDWLRAHSDRFRAELRYRHGMPISPASLVADLLSPRSSGVPRSLLLDELAIRYGVRLPIEADTLVADQVRSLAAAQQELAAKVSVVPGKWYFNANEISNLV